ncbi:MAG: M23 family metallopeptidase [Acidimicrobiia bacterium]|nr:M23 family metallopeptidase [Acidimicrobiia bacterium]MYC57269.1 M23 family metallopeptidase [Acidimicrobiia bacterium]MYI30941.1 M23 family metallopeptidase [Acidimicrobiia bacterium]
MAGLIYGRCKRCWVILIWGQRRFTLMSAKNVCARWCKIVILVLSGVWRLKDLVTWGFICGLAAFGMMLLLEQGQLEVRLVAIGQMASAQPHTVLEPLVVRYNPPLQAEIVDYFRPPAHIGAPGNRGWEYNPEPGQPVHASAAGEVVFAGVVVGNRFLTLRHLDGLRTTYGYLAQIQVVEGEMVEAEQLIGTTTGRFFFSVRAGDEYLDPASVLAAGRVRLVA